MLIVLCHGNRKKLIHLIFMKFNLYCKKGNNTNKIIKTMQMMLKTVIRAN